MKYLVKVDVAWNTPKHEIDQHFEEAGATIENYVRVGPGGGNPCYTLSFPTRDQAEKFAIDWHSESGESDHAWMRSLVKEVA